MKLEKVFVRNFIETLPENELKNYVAGYGYGDDEVAYGSGTCCGKFPDSIDGGGCLCGVTKTYAWNMARCDYEGKNCSGNWCCDSCTSATWSGGCD